MPSRGILLLERCPGARGPFQSGSPERRRRRTALAAAALCAGLLAGSPAGAAPDVRVSVDQARALGIETAAPRAQSGGELHGLPAQVTVPPAQMLVVSAPLAGLIEQVGVALNEPVRRNQRLARLQSPALADMQRGFLQAAAQFDLARGNAQRDEALFKEGIIAESRHRASASQLAEATAALAERRQALKLAGMSDGALDRLRSERALSSQIDVLAPIDGVVVEQPAIAGQRVEAAAPLFTVARLSPLWLEIQVPIGQAARIRERAAVTVPAHQAGGRVITIGRSVSANQTIMVRAEISQGAEHLRPGQLVEANLSSGAAGPARHWGVPAAALVRSGGRTLVFVQVPGGFRAQPVTLISESATDAVVAGELNGSEAIAVRGVAALKAALAGIGSE